MWKGEPAYVGRDGRRYPLGVPRWRGDDGLPLSISDLPGLGRDEILRGTRSLWRYAAALPLDGAGAVSLGEGCTPLVERAFGGGRPLFKLEWFAPTASFKDRGASVMISALHQQKVIRVLEDSSGNGGAAVAAYGAAAGMAVTIMAPDSTSPAKTVQARAHGATVELVPGSRQATADAAVARAADIFYASHNWQPFFLQGTKTLAYELWEDLDFRAPDNIVIPTGAGSNIMGCDIGFGELLHRGEIARLPRLFAAQPAHCAPFVDGAPDPRPTIAEGAAIARPVRQMEVMRALARSGGGGIAIAEEEIVAAFRALAAIGLYAEPTSALAGAAYARLLAAGTIRERETTVVVLTGGGTKATQRIGEMLS